MGGTVLITKQTLTITVKEEQKKEGRREGEKRGKEGKRKEKLSGKVQNPGRSKERRESCISEPRIKLVKGKINDVKVLLSVIRGGEDENIKKRGRRKKWEKKK